MTTTERIQDLLESVETDVRKATVEDFLIDLRETLKVCKPDETAGLRVAIEILETNY